MLCGILPILIFWCGIYQNLYSLPPSYVTLYKLPTLFSATLLYSILKSMASSSSIYRFSSFILKTPSSLLNFQRILTSPSSRYLHSSSSPSQTSLPQQPQTNFNKTHFNSPFSTSSQNPISPPPKRNTLVNYSASESESDSDSSELDNSMKKKPTTTTATTAKILPPPYDPFGKKPAVEEHDDPKNLQEVFHKIRADGLFDNAVKMFDGLSKEGLTHEALELFGRIKDRGEMPEVVAHTAVIEAYVNAGQAKEAYKVYLRMLVSGVLPNAYTYGVLIKGLMESGDGRVVKEGRKVVEEMMKRGMKPNGVVCVAVYEGMVRVGMEEEGREVLEMVKTKGVVPDEGKVREALKGKRGKVYRDIMSVFYGK